MSIGYTSVMKLIFAQGNPGQHYAATRHNVGFRVLDFYADLHSLEFQTRMKFNADIAELSREGEKILFVKPMTFYNETGISARAVADFYKINPNNILVIHDELTLPFGKLRIRHTSRDAGNNGIKSLNAHLSGDFARIKIGIQNDLRDKMADSDFVLGKFSTDEEKVLSSLIFQETASCIDRFIKGDLVDESITLE